MKALALAVFLTLGFDLYGQQLFIEGFLGFNRTKYKNASFANNDVFNGYGARLGFGADHVQVGGEFRNNFDNPIFQYSNSSWSFQENYFGGFIRTKISRYPAMRFGLVLKGGVGAINTEAIWEEDGIEITKAYETILGFYGSLGVSTPIYKYAKTMIEFNYTYSYAHRPELTVIEGRTPFPSHNAITHILQIGLSHNFVFGERAKKYEHARQNWKYRKGWRG